MMMMTMLWWLELYDIRFSRHHQILLSLMPFAFLSFVFLGNIRRSLLPLKDVSVSFFLECAWLPSNVQRDRQTDRPTDQHTDRQTDRQNGRQARIGYIYHVLLSGSVFHFQGGKEDWFQKINRFNTSNLKTKSVSNI